MIKRVICLVFAMVLVVSFFGCAASGDNKDDVNTDMEASTNTDVETSAEDKESVSNKNTEQEEEVVYRALSHGRLVHCVGHLSGAERYDCHWEKTNYYYKWTEFEKKVVVYFEKCSVSFCTQDHIILINGKEERIKPRQYYIFENVSQISIPFIGHHYPCIELSLPLTEEYKDEQDLEAYQGKKPIIMYVEAGNNLYKKKIYCGKCLEEIENQKYNYCPYCNSKIIWGDNNEN